MALPTIDITMLEPGRRTQYLRLLEETRRRIEVGSGDFICLTLGAVSHTMDSTRRSANGPPYVGAAIDLSDMIATALGSHSTLFGWQQGQAGFPSSGSEEYLALRDGLRDSRLAWLDHMIARVSELAPDAMGAR